MTLPHLHRSVLQHSVLPQRAARIRFANKRAPLSALAVFCLALPVVCFAQQPDTGNTVQNVTAANASADILPAQTLGANDLLQIVVPYCPELSRSFRISSDGTLELPLLKKSIDAAGLQPVQLQKKIAAELITEQVLTDPTVSVSVLEYRSKPVSVVGAVNHPLTFQASEGTTLLDAITRAGGLATTVGPTITVTHREQSADGTMHVTVQSIPVKGLIDSANQMMNVTLTGNDEVRVPEAGRIFVAGNVHKPGSFAMQDNSDTTVVKALAMSEGLNPYSSKLAYIYREAAPGTPRQEIAVPLSQIMARKAPDVVLQADDILYVPENNGKRMTAKILSQLAGFSSTTATGLLIYH
jgi:polysaccharide export outer membrane protein